MWLSQSFISFLSDVKEGLNLVVSLIFILLCLGAIVFSVFMVWRRIKKPGPAVLVSNSITFVLMIPLVLLSTWFLQLNAQQYIRNVEGQRLQVLNMQVRQKELERDNLEKQNELVKKNIALASLENQVALLKFSQISALQFKKIAELALIQTNIQQTKVYYKLMDNLQSGMGFRADYFGDHVLIISNHDIDAKFGIDISKIMVKKTGSDGILVSGLRPIYIGSPKNITKHVIKEIRRTDFDSKGNINRVNIKNDKKSLQIANDLAENFNAEYQSSLRKMEEFEFLQGAIVSLGKHFIEIIFAPAYSDIQFAENVPEGSLPLEEYIATEIKSLEGASRGASRGGELDDEGFLFDVSPY